MSASDSGVPNEGAKPTTSTPPAPWAPFALRVGAVLAAPARALVRIDASGGGLRDAVYLALLGIVCFWLRDLVEALLGLSHLPFTDVLGRLLQLVSLAFREAAVVILPAAVGLTLLAGRGRRDPSRDVELAAACYVPAFAVRAVQRTVSLDVFLGPLPPPIYRLVAWLGAGWALLIFLLALRVARRRGAGDQDAGRLAARGASWGASGVLVALMTVALFVNAAWVARNAHAVKPFGAGDAVPTFTLKRANGPGGAVSLSAFQGKVVLLDFWASWCGPCLKLAPVLAALHEEWGPRGFEVVSINTDLTFAELQEFLKTHPAPYPVLMADEAGRVAEQFKVVNLPHLVILNQQGHAAQTFWGYKTRSQLETVIRELVSSP